MLSASQVHLVDGTFLEYILPLPTSEATLAEDVPSWVDRFLQVESLLESSSPSQRQALFSLTRLIEGRGGSVWEAYLQACDKNNVSAIPNQRNDISPRRS
jgi:sister-chromatid-cohesion protein PDS5